MAALFIEQPTVAEPIIENSLISILNRTNMIAAQEYQRSAETDGLQEFYLLQ
jgi:hypothetical protein